MSIRSGRNAVITVVVWSVCSACSESRTAPAPAQPRLAVDRAALPAPIAGLQADVSIRVAPVGRPATRAVRYHMARSKRDGKWGTTLTIPPRTTGMPRAQDVARIEIDDAGIIRAFDRDGRAMDFNAPVPQLPIVSHPTMTRLEALLPRKAVAASNATPRAAVGESYLVESRLAEETRRTLVARFGAPKSENGRDVFTIEGADTRSIYRFDPAIGAVVEAHVRKNDGTSVDVETRYDQVRPGLFVRSYVSTLFSSPGMSRAMKSEITLSNVRVEGQP